MDISVILDAVTVVGFPIVMCIIFMVYVKYLTDMNRDQINSITGQHREEMREITQAVENNTLALTQLIEKLN